MEQNKTGKYFKYAIGEIVLVVIGILIALSVNNWNEERKNTIQLNNALNSLETEIWTNMSYLERQIEICESELLELEYSINTINTPNPEKITDEIIDEIIELIGPFTFLPLRKSAYSNIISSGLINYMKDDSLKLDIIDLERGFQIYDKQRTNMDNSWEQKLKPYYMKHADLLVLKDTLYKDMAPNSYVQLNKLAFVNNQEFSNMLTQRLFVELNSKTDFNRINNFFNSIKNEITSYIELH